MMFSEEHIQRVQSILWEPDGKCFEKWKL